MNPQPLMPDTWLATLPGLVIVLATMVVPGLLVALGWRLRPLDALGAAVPVSLGVLALIDVAATVSHLNWGLPVVIGGSLVAGLLAFVSSFVLRAVEARFVPTRADGIPEHATDRVLDAEIVSDADTIRRHRTAGAEHDRFAFVMVVVGGLLGGFAAIRGIESPSNLNQTYDGPFHVNGIMRVAEFHSASPATVSSVWDTPGEAGFYPPLFHAIGALLPIHLGWNAMAAANVVAVATCMVWPAAVSLWVRTLLGRDRLALGVGMFGAAVIGLFPAALLTFGVLWPNAVSLLAVPTILAFELRILGLDRGRSRVPLTVCWAGLLVSMPGLYYAHPGAAFALVPLSLPMFFEALIRLIRNRARKPGTRRGSIAIVVGVAVVFVAAWEALYHVPGLDNVRHLDWPARESAEQAFGEMLLLGTPRSPSNLGFAILLLLGAWVLLRARRDLWLPVTHLLIAWLAFRAASDDHQLTQVLTGFWYNDSFRLAALLPVTALPLAGLGARWLVEQIERLLAGRPWQGTRGEPVVERTSDLAMRAINRLPQRPRSLATDWLATPHRLAVVSVLVLMMLFQPGSTGIGAISKFLKFGYATNDPTRTIVSPDEAAMYQRLPQYLKPDQTIAGDPWQGEVYGKLFTGHNVIFPFFKVALSDDSDIVMLRFRQFATDPEVCEAVKRLKIGIVVADSQGFLGDRGAAPMTGFEDLASAPGLEVIDIGGTATAYRLTTCTSD